MTLPNFQKAQTIKKIFPISNGIFNHMQYTFRAEVTKNSLDMMFIANYGKRNPSPIVEMLQDEYGDVLSDAELTQLATVIVEMYKEKWDKLGEIYDIEYDPIHNYLDEWEDTSSEDGESEVTTSGTDSTTYGKTESSTILRTDNLSQARSVSEEGEVTRTDDLTKTETRNLERSTLRTDNLSEQTTYGRTNTRTDNLTETRNLTTGDNGSSSSDNTLYAFNSAAAVDVDGSSSSNTNTRTETGTVADTGTQANAMSGSDTILNTGTRTDATDDSGTVTIADEGTETTASEKSISDTVLNTGTRTTTDQTTHGGTDSTIKSGSSNETSSRERDRSGRHFGNIGNLTSQKQILEEINLWKWNYMQEILNDVKEFCTLPVYLNATEWQLVNQDD